MADLIAPAVDDARPEAAGGATSTITLDAIATPERLVDPAVSRAKFAREIDAYRAREAEYRTRGWFLVRAEFPEVFVLMAAPQLRPTTIVYGLLLDFRDYDLIAPALRFVNPFTGESLPVKDVPRVHKRLAVAPAAVNGRQAPAAEGGPCCDSNADAPAQRPVAPQVAPPDQFGNFVQGHGDHPAFLCVAGTREYHAHPYHSNDPWLAHRGTGPGTLHYLLNIVWRHGVIPLVSYQIQVSVNMVPQADPRRIP